MFVMSGKGIHREIWGKWSSGKALSSNIGKSPGWSPGLSYVVLVGGSGGVGDELIQPAVLTARDLPQAYTAATNLLLHDSPL